MKGDIDSLDTQREHLANYLDMTKLIQSRYSSGFDLRHMDYVLDIPEEILDRLDVDTTDVAFEDIFHPEIDQCDNKEQEQIIKDHYLNEFGRHRVAKVLKDYSSDSVIHEVVDGVPHTYRGKTGAVQMCQDLFDLEHVELQHIAVNHGHAQVVWLAETPSHSKIVGTDSLTFDKDNHIITQSIVALSEKFDL